MKKQIKTEKRELEKEQEKKGDRMSYEDMRRYGKILAERSNLNNMYHNHYHDMMGTGMSMGGTLDKGNFTYTKKVRGGIWNRTKSAAGGRR